MQNPPHCENKALDDNTLVSLAQSGNRQAFELLIERHYNACRKLACSILRDASDAEDEVQNASCRAFQRIAQFQFDAKFSTWLTRIVVNQCFMRLRQMRRSRVLYFEDTTSSGSPHPVDFPSVEESPEERLGKAQIAGVLRNEIRRIPPLLRDVYVLRDVQEMPIQAVADELGISVSAAKSRLLRARTELRARLEKHQGRLGPATLLASPRVGRAIAGRAMRT